jgi:hypothetical protein
MLLKVIIISFVLMTFIILALGVKLLLDHDAEFPSHACSTDNLDQDEITGCSGCNPSDLASCQRKLRYRES